MQKPRLRDSKSKRYELYPLGQMSNETVKEIARQLVYCFAVGKSDISGEDWGDILARALDANHLNSPIGLADVIHGSMAWSVKSVKNTKPHECLSIRVISGRCSPDYSYGISNPHDDVQKTGTAVLGIWNERVNIAKDTYEPLRALVLIRNPKTLEFSLYEQEVHRYNTSEYSWVENKNGNIEGYQVSTGRHTFTWQPHGAQFTVIYSICSRINFKIKRPPTLDFAKTLEQIGFNDSWITIG